MSIIHERGCCQLRKGPTGWKITGKRELAIKMGTNMIVYVDNIECPEILLLESYARKVGSNTLTIVTESSKELLKRRGYVDGVITREGMLSHVTWFAADEKVAESLVTLGFTRERQTRQETADILVGYSKTLNLKGQVECICIFLTDTEHFIFKGLDMSVSARMANIYNVSKLDEIPDLCSWNS